MEGIGFWEGFWQMVHGWDPFGQGIFFLIVIVGFFNLILYVSRYVAVMFRGWPPYSIWHNYNREDDDED